MRYVLIDAKQHDPLSLPTELGTKPSQWAAVCSALAFATLWIVAELLNRV